VQCVTPLYMLLSGQGTRTGQPASLGRTMLCALSGGPQSRQIHSNPFALLLQVRFHSQLDPVRAPVCRKNGSAGPRPTQVSLVVLNAPIWYDRGTHGARLPKLVLLSPVEHLRRV
jgi:hypothetical protein